MRTDKWANAASKAMLLIVVALALGNVLAGIATPTPVKTDFIAAIHSVRPEAEVDPIPLNASFSNSPIGRSAMMRFKIKDAHGQEETARVSMAKSLNFLPWKTSVEFSPP